jgi:serpin B
VACSAFISEAGNAVSCAKKTTRQEDLIMKKKLLSLAMILVCLIFVACAAEADSPVLISLAAPPITPPASLFSTAQGPQETSHAVAQGANDFAFALTASLLQETDNENFIFSPYSVWLPLAALLNATHENYRESFTEIIAAEGLCVSDINRAASRMLFDLTNERRRLRNADAENPLQIANAIFADHRQTLNTSFAQTFADYFRGAAKNIDFSSPAAVTAVNQWAYENTNGRISEVIQEFHPDTVAAIANAIYFSDQWQSPFNPANTRRDIFHAPTGDTYAYFMQQSWSHTNYFENDQMQSVTLSFETGGGLTILLPKNGNATELLANMTTEKFTKIAQDSVTAQGTLLLPRFSIQNTINLPEALSRLGLSPLFCEKSAPLTELIYSPHPCFIDQAVQVALLEIDEKGATAAAVTIMVAVAESAPPTPEVTFEIICNRPFALILHRPTTDGGKQILFTAVINHV